MLYTHKADQSMCKLAYKADVSKFKLVGTRHVSTYLQVVSKTLHLSGAITTINWKFKFVISC